MLRWSTTKSDDVQGENIVFAPGSAELAPHAAQGTITSLPMMVEPGADEIIMSWQGRTTGGAVIEVALRAEVGFHEARHWTRWWTLGVWSEDAALRHSVAGQHDADGVVYTDTLTLNTPAQRVQWRVILWRGTAGASPSLRGCTLTLKPAPASTSDVDYGAIAALPVPSLRQYDFPAGAGWCSPTSLTMVLGYWAAQTRDPMLVPFTDPQAVATHTAPGVYDCVYEGTGNWVFNTAYAASLGLEAYIACLPSLNAVAAYVAAGVPVIASVRWRPGELDDAPVAHSNGHLVVIVGFTATGDVIVNDPAAESAARVRRTYRREQFERVWQAASGGAVYVIYPPHWRDA